MVFMGNTQKLVAYMLKHSHFFEPLPDKYIDSAFFDRIHAYNPGWEVAPIRHELFTSGYGFVVDLRARRRAGLFSRLSLLHTASTILLTVFRPLSILGIPA
jgi:predicted ATP-dependent Lon-type protease